MRRLTILLMVLLLPCAAMAEAWHAQAKIDVNEAYLEALLSTVLPDEDDSGLNPAVISRLLDGSGVDVTVQPDGLSFSLSFGDKKLVDFAAIIQGEKLLITSGLFRGYALSVPYASPGTALSDEAVDWNALLVTILESAMNTQLDVEMESAAGAFAGDAYTGGAFCRICVVEDRDIAQLMSSILNDDVRSTAATLLAELGIDARVFFARLDEMNERASTENAHRYIIRLVEDSEHDPIGASVTILRDASQVATLSIGLNGNSLHIVLGMGTDHENIWYDHFLFAEGTTGKYQIAGTCHQFTGMKDEDFAYAAAVLEEPLSLLHWVLEIEKTDGALSWDYQHQVTGSWYPFVERVTCIGNREAKTGTISSSLSMMADGTDLVNAAIEASRTDEAIAPPDSTLTVCDLSSAVEEQMMLQMEIEEHAMQMLTIRLMTILPLDLMLMP